MSELLIGQLNRNFPVGIPIPDAYFIKRDLKKLDQQARLLETPGLAEALRIAVESIPGASFHYSDCSGIYSGEARPGYVLEGRASRIPDTHVISEGWERTHRAVDGYTETEVGLILSSDGKVVNASSAISTQGFGEDADDGKRKAVTGVSTRYISQGPRFEAANGTIDAADLFTYIGEIGLVPADDLVVVHKALLRYSKQFDANFTAGSAVKYGVGNEIVRNSSEDPIFQIIKHF